MSVIQKKICMVGVHGTGKTSLVRRFVHSMFSEKYHTTIGVKIDRKELTLGDTTVRLLLWDLEGRTEGQEIGVGYLRGAHGVFVVADGTRRETFDQAFELRELVHRTVGAVPSLLALNKSDLTDQWQLGDADYQRVDELGWHRIMTSAKSGEQVNDAFDWLARTTVGAP